MIRPKYKLLLVAVILAAVGAQAAQDVTIDFRAPANASVVNKHISTGIPAGIHTGFEVIDGSSAGELTITAGVLYTDEGVRIEETTNMVDAVTVPTNSSGVDRIDLVVAEYTYAQTIPQPTASYSIVVGSPVAAGSAGQYALATLYVPNGTNVPTRISSTVRHSRTADPGFGWGFANNVLNKIIIGDGVTSGGQLQGHGGIIYAIDQVNQLGGGTVELVGDDFGAYDPTPVKLKSGVILDGVSSRQLRNLAGGYFGIEGTSGTGAIADDDRLTDGAKDFNDYGIGSMVWVTSGVNANVYYIKEIVSATEIRLVSIDYDPVTLTNDASATYDLYISRAGIRNLYLQGELLTSVSDAIRLNNTVGCFIENVVIDNLGSAETNAIVTSGNNLSLRLDNLEVVQGYTNALNAASGLNENWRVLNGQFSGNVLIATTGAGEIMYDNNLVSGTETIPATAGWRGRSALAEHNKDGTHAFINTLNAGTVTGTSGTFESAKVDHDQDATTSFHVENDNNTGGAASEIAVTSDSEANGLFMIWVEGAGVNLGQMTSIHGTRTTGIAFDAVPSGSAASLYLYASDSGDVVRNGVQLYPDGDVAIGTYDLALSSTNGFPHLSAVTGKPTGSPALLPSGFAPVVMDDSNNAVWVYLSSAWYGIELSTDGKVSGQLAEDSVTALELQDDASVDANRAVTTNHVRDYAITSAKLAEDAVDATALQDDASVDANRAVTTDHIRDSAVTSAKIANSTIVADDLASFSISNLKLQSGCVNEYKVSGAVARWVAGAHGDASAGQLAVGSNEAGRAGNVSATGTNGTDAYTGADHSDFLIRREIDGQYSIEPPVVSGAADLGDYILTVFPETGDRSHNVAINTTYGIPHWSVHFYDLGTGVPALTDFYFYVLKVN